MFNRGGVLYIYLSLRCLTGFLEVEEYAEVIQRRLYRPKGFGPIFLLLDFLQDLLRPLGVVPKIGGVGQLLFLGNLLKSVIDVKDASSERRRDRKGL